MRFCFTNRKTGTRISEAEPFQGPIVAYGDPHPEEDLSQLGRDRMPSPPGFCWVALWNEWVASVRCGVTGDEWHKKHDYDCSVCRPFWQHGWIANGCGNCSETPKQGPSYVEEPALPSPFDILLLTTNFEIHSPFDEHKESQLSTTIILLVQTTPLCSSTHMTKFVFHSVSWARLNWRIIFLVGFIFFFFFFPKPVLH